MSFPGHAPDGRVPRVRGDGPFADIQESPVVEVFPACAGMDRSCPGRGRGPATCSPRARGWTEPTDGTLEEAGVFPACAGMDRVKI